MTLQRVCPTAVRGLWEGGFVSYGAIGLVMSALLLTSAGYATLASGVLPRWTDDWVRVNGVQDTVNDI